MNVTQLGDSWRFLECEMEAYLGVTSSKGHPYNNLGPWGTTVLVGAEAEEPHYVCAKNICGTKQNPPQGAGRQALDNISVYSEGWGWGLI